MANNKSQSNDEPEMVAEQPATVDYFGGAPNQLAEQIEQRRAQLEAAEKTLNEIQANVNRLRVEIDALNAVRAAQGLQQI